MADRSIALIVGASRGLGLALAEEWLKRDAHVIATVRSPSQELKALHDRYPESLEIEFVDIVDEASVRALLRHNRLGARRPRVDTGLDTPLLWYLRDELGLTGTRFGCGAGLCGCCTVHVNNEATRSCSITGLGFREHYNQREILLQIHCRCSKHQSRTRFKVVGQLAGSLSI